MQRTERSVVTRAGAACACWIAVVLAVRAAPQTNAAPAPQPSPGFQLTVLEFNVEYGGTHVSWTKTLQVIRRSGADVVGIEEAQGHTARLARGAGYPYFSPRLQVLSRFPIVDPPDGDGIYVFIEVEPGRVVAMENVHLPSNPYGPFRVKQGATRSEVVAIERRLRVPAIRPSLREARELVELEIPVVLVGDFNAPSWRDWTPEMVGTRYQIRYPVKWPVSRAVERAGFVDSYRSVRPDPNRDPGLTWWAARPDLPGWNPGSHAPQDRIDFVYAAGVAEATRSEILGEAGVEGVDVAVRPWPSDHRAVATTFAITPGTMPPLIAVQHRLVSVGDDLITSFPTAGTAGGTVALVPAVGDPATDAIIEQPTAAALDGTLAFGTGTMAPGGYEAVLLDGVGAEVSRAAFWLKDPGAGPEIATDKDLYRVGEPIDVRWSNTRGERWDWVGVFGRHRDPRVASYLLWLYTGATVEGSAVLDEGANGSFPLGPGRYSVYLLRDDGYRKLASADFAIEA